MSDPQREAETTDQPGFEIAFRGYDRAQVDTVLRTLSERLIAEQDRAERVETAAAQLQRELASTQKKEKPSYEHLGTEAARVLQRAGQSAAALVDAATARSEAIVRQAEERAAALLEQAQQRVAEAEGKAERTMVEAAGRRDAVLAEARKEAQRLLEAAAGEQRAVQAETARIRDGREQLRADLGRVRGQLDQLLGAAAEPAVEQAGR
jgi:cell division septum initiation protein DivIVA